MHFRRLLAFALALVVAAGAHAGDDDEVARLRASAKAALAAGRADDARRELLTALSVRPLSVEVLADLLTAAGTDADEREVWALHLAAVATDAKGKLAGVAANSDAAKAASEHGVALAKLRAQTVANLGYLADKLKGPGDAETALVVARLARLLYRQNAAVRDVWEPRFAAALARTSASPDEVIARLRVEIAKARKSGKSDLAFLGARALRGLGAQKRRTTGGSAPDPLETEALVVLEAVRQERWAKWKALTVDDLRAIPFAERRAWEMGDSTWDSPALVVSPRGHYRIESVQGPRTNLMVALDIDGVHERLARFVGRDPFVGKPGTLRLVRDVIDMEAEGQTLVWARGFNAGEVTTMPGGPTIRRWMSRGYSHELLHRFDGELYGWLPGWLREGRANWAQSADLWVGATELDARAVAFDMLARAKFAGYGDVAKLSALLDGRPATPQDDYDTGYSLWLYLSRYRRDWYAPKIDTILTGQRALGMKGAKDLFVAQMCDGKDGRPASLDALAKDFQAFLDAASAAKPEGWAKEWADASRAAIAESDKKRATPVPNAKELEFAGDEDVFDLSNHAPVRTRSAAPPFGATHAYTAGTFFEAVGDADGARAAYAWSRRVDEPMRESLLRMAGFHEKTGNAVAAWLLRAEASRMGSASPGPPPAAIAKLFEPLASALVKGWETCATAKLPRAAELLLSEEARLRDAMGTLDAAPPPGVEPAELLVPLGLVAAAWAPSQAAAGATTWCARGPYDLVVGRAAPGTRDDATGSDVSQRAVFVETATTFDAGFTLRTRVRPLSSIAPPSVWSPSIAVVVGKTGDDRGLMVNLVPGPSAAAGGFDSVVVRLDDQRACDWGVANLEADVKLSAPGTSFDLALTVRGAYALVEIDGRAVLSFGTATGLALAGHVGFLVPWGVSPAEFRDLRIERRTDARPPWFELWGDETSAPVAWDGLRVNGVANDPLGTLVLLPQSEPAAAALSKAPQLLGAADLGARIRVALREGTDGKGWEGALPLRVRPRGLSGAAAENATLWLALDGEGVVRSHGRWVAGDPGLTRAVTLFRRLRGW